MSDIRTELIIDAACVLLAARCPPESTGLAEGYRRAVETLRGFTASIPDKVRCIRCRVEVEPHRRVPPPGESATCDACQRAEDAFDEEEEARARQRSEEANEARGLS